MFGISNDWCLPFVRRSGMMRGPLWRSGIRCWVGSSPRRPVS